MCEKTVLRVLKYPSLHHSVCDRCYEPMLILCENVIVIVMFVTVTL